MDKFIWIVCIAAAIGQCLTEAYAQGKSHSKTKSSGGRNGFYSSRFGSIYQAQDFVEQPTTTGPDHLKALQVPTGVAAPHQQNIDSEINSEVPNIEEHTVPNLPIFREELRHGVKGGIHEGVKGGIKGGIHEGVKGSIKGGIQEGVKGGIKGGIQEGVKGGIKGGVKGHLGLPDSLIRLTTVPPTEYPIRVTVLPDALITTPSENLRRKTKKGIKGGKKGYQYDVNIKALFSDPTTEVPFTTVTSFVPKILNLPTERHIQAETVAPTTENYRQETVAPIQQTEQPSYQLTEEPIQQTELPIQQTEQPVQQTELPVQQTELPVQQTELPVQQTELPVQQTELPVQQTEVPVRETEATTTWRPTTIPYEPVQETQSPQVTQKPEYPTELPDDQQVLQEVSYTTQVPTTVRPSDEFSRYPLGLEGRHQLKGVSGGKGKGGKGKGAKVSPKSHTISVVSRGTSGISGRRSTTGRIDPGTPLLPSLRG